MNGIRPEIKAFYSVDIELPLEKYFPEVEDEFGFWARMIIGEKNTGGEESFDVMICSPKWLINNYAKTDLLFGKHHLIVFEYNYDRIYHKLKRFIDRIEEDIWDEI
jgi:hypothetical protein